MKKKYWLLLLGFVVLVLIITVCIIDSKQSSGRLKVSFFDVGQGDASLIQTANGLNILIDGGPDNKVLYGLSQALPWWDRTIDLMILTHPHDDHVSGLIDVIRKYKVRKILYTGIVHASPAYLAWLKEVKAKKIELKIIDRPQDIKLGENCDFKIIYPSKSFLNIEMKNLNNSSIVGQLDCENKKILFMGDAEKEVEQELLSSYDNLDSDIIKTGHHGSDTSSTEDFLRAVNPKTAIISVGKNNMFGLPDLQVVRRLERLGIKVLRTDIDGAVYESF